MKFFFDLTLISSLRIFLSNSNATFFLFIPLTSSKKSSDKIDISGFLIQAASKISITHSDTTALSTICLIDVSISSSLFQFQLGSNLVRRAFIAWKNQTQSFISIAFKCGNERAYALDNNHTSLVNLFFQSSNHNICS